MRTRVTQAQRRTLRFAYEVIHQESGDLIATGETTHVICDHQGRPKSLPEKYRKYFSPGLSEGSEHPPAKLTPGSKAHR